MEELLLVDAIQNVEVAEMLAAQPRRLPMRREDPFRTLNMYLTPPTRRSAISKQTKVLAALQFFGCGSYQTPIGYNEIFGLSQSSISRCIAEVVNALNEPAVINAWVKFPRTRRELDDTRQRFYQKFGLPGVIGCIDCTRVAIFPPIQNHDIYPEHIYINRKNNHSINVQLICDDTLKITNVNARFPGSIHDAYIWSQSNIEQAVSNLSRRNPGYYLIGKQQPLLAIALHLGPPAINPTGVSNLYTRIVRLRMSTKKYYKYSQDDLNNALIAIKHGTPCATAAKRYNVPRTTLIGKINGTYPEDCRSGVSPVLTSEEESILVDWILTMARIGLPVTKQQLLDSVTLLIKNLKRPNKFTNGRPGRHWYEGFLRRHPQISQRMTQNLTASRAAVSKKSIETWFEEIKNYFISSNITIEEPERIFNADESAFFLSPKGNSVLAKKGSKTVYDRSGNDRECLTVLITANAAGCLAPPMVMYPYERIPKHIVMQVPKDWGIGKSETGWMTSESFYEYISNIFYPWLISMKIEFPVLLYVDGHRSHITLPLSDFCRKKQIILISLLPNSTHILQPLDVGLFKTLKNSWKNYIREYRTQNQFKPLNRENFAPRS
ncbi:hypothetical protein NQ315_014924 [Exocentrus adspersus]|uniref:HTH CENPB-type domain-containing protein n=1 Tax=Exocentrus adspersus TaxID=1586481 RepID=A0AAV8VB59_9CUCU|nr:hypothetical protein NQ315_014924 [Exocentrus adspersus]